MANLYTILPGAGPSRSGPEEVGNKAWNLMRMAERGLPVPPAFVLPTSWCQHTPSAAEPALGQALSAGIARLEAATGLGLVQPAGRYLSLFVQVRRCRCRE